MFFFIPDARVAIQPPTVLNSMLRGCQELAQTALQAEAAAPVGLVTEGEADCCQAPLQITTDYSALKAAVVKMIAWTSERDVRV
jgi:hypothetical protein